MYSHGTIPLKTTHLICGAASYAGIHPRLTGGWVKAMLDDKDTITEAWFNAGTKTYNSRFVSMPDTNSVVFRVVGYTECFADKVSNYATNYTISPQNIDKRDKEVFHYVP
jgi:hypothetical protein